MFGRSLIGRGRLGSAGMGFRGISPPYPYVGRGRGGLPRCAYPGNWANIFPAAPGITREQEISLLKSQAENIKQELDIIESRIRDLESNKKE